MMHCTEVAIIRVDTGRADDRDQCLGVARGNRVVGFKPMVLFLFNFVIHLSLI